MSEKNNVTSTIDYDKLAEKLAPYLKPEPVATSEDLPEDAILNEKNQVVYLDSLAEKIDNIQGKALDALPLGLAVYRGKGGTVTVNHSQETLEAAENFRKNRRQFRTRTRI